MDTKSSQPVINSYPGEEQHLQQLLVIYCAQAERSLYIDSNLVKSRWPFDGWVKAYQPQCVGKVELPAILSKIYD